MIAKDDKPTPQHLFDRLNREFGFTIDVAASADNAKCARFYDRAQDALRLPWTGVVWCNPPYGAGLGKWVQKGHDEAKNGSVVVMLLPASTDTIWFHRYCLRAEIRFIKGRLRFGNTDGTAPFGSMVVIFRPTFAALDL